MAFSRVPIIDLHAHVPMQARLPPRTCDSLAQTVRNQFLMDVANRVGNFHNGRPRYNLGAARREGVNIGSVLFVPSDELFGTCGGLRNLEQQLEDTTARLTKVGYVIASNGRDFQTRIEDGTPAAFHCLEGGYSIEHPSQVETLARHRLAYVILAHLLFRDRAACVNALPFFTDEMYERLLPMPVKGLTGTGAEICSEMCRLGIVPDITHMTKEAAGEVFAIARSFTPPRPVIVSHGAPQGMSENEYKLNLDAEIIERIRDSGGVIGVIWFDHWLLPPCSQFRAKGSIADVVAAVRRIETVAGTTECVAIGSDLDGFIQPVEGLENIGRIRALEEALRQGYSDEQVQGILWKNAARTLTEGWVTVL